MLRNDAERHIERKHSEAAMIGALKQVEAGPTAADVAGELGASKHTIFAREAKYGGLEAAQFARHQTPAEYARQLAASAGSALRATPSDAAPLESSSQSANFV